MLAWRIFPLALVLFIAPVSLSSAQSICPTSFTPNPAGDGCLVNISVFPNNAFPYEGNERMQIEWDAGAYNGATVEVSLAVHRGFSAGGCNDYLDTNVLNEEIPNTGNYSWIIANFDHDEETNYTIHIHEVGVPIGSCPVYGISSFFTLVGSLSEWVYPPQEGFVIVPGETHVVQVRNMFHPRRVGLVFDLMASIDNFNLDTAATHSWKQSLQYNSSYSLERWANEQNPPHNLTAYPKELKDIPNWLGFPEEFPGFIEMLPQDEIETDFNLSWTIPNDLTAYFRQSGTIYTKTRDNNEVIMLSDPDVVIQIQLRMLIHNSAEFERGECDCRVENNACPYNATSNCTLSYGWFDINGDNIWQSTENFRYFSPTGRVDTSRSPTMSPTISPSLSPSVSPTVSPTQSSPTLVPSFLPTGGPTVSTPTLAPTGSPSLSTPTKSPTESPSNSPPSNAPTGPSGIPTGSPTESPASSAPTPAPTTMSPTNVLPTPLPTEVQAETNLQGDSGEGFEEWWILLLILLLLLCCCLGLFFIRNRREKKKEPVYSESGPGKPGWERENPAYEGLGGFFVGDKPRDDALNNDSYVHLDRNHDTIQNVTYAAVNHYGAARESAYGEVLPDDSRAAIPNATYTAVEPDPDTNYGELGSVASSTPTYAILEPEVAGDDYIDAGGLHPARNENDTYIEAGPSGALQQRHQGSVRNQVYGTASADSEFTYDEVKATLGDGEYASTDQVNGKQALQTEVEGASLYEASRTSAEPQPVERKNTLWDINEAPTHSARKESQPFTEPKLTLERDGSMVRLESVRRINPMNESENDGSLSQRRKASGATIPSDLNMPPEWEPAPQFTPLISPAGSRDFNEPDKPSSPSQSAEI